MTHEEPAAIKYPLLDAIEKPSDLRQLDYDQLAELASQMRQFIVEAVSATGGHLGSNLGVVELTLALHRVFDSPHDFILFDTGHLCYPHKLVTGRKAEFSALRQLNGLSGYPARAESEHDWIENSHASTVLSYAHGLSQAMKRQRSVRRVVALIGDGSMTGGMAYEALNNIGHSNSKVLVVLNDNGRSYAPTVSRWVQGLSQIRLNTRLVNRKNRIEESLGKIPRVGHSIEKAFKAFELAVREAALEPTAFFEALGVRYLGPIDGHDVAEIEKALRAADEWDGPVVVHALTQKGRGYGPAEDDDEKHLHDVQIFNPLTGPTTLPKEPLTWTKVFSDSLLEEARKDSRIVAITAAMPGPTGLLAFQKEFPDRFFDVGIAEQHAVTMAAGMAMGGLKPVVAVYSTFLSRAFDQVNLDVALHKMPVVFCLDRAGITGPDGPSHHGVLDMVLLSKIPGMTVLTPSSAADFSAMMQTALEIETGPTVIRYPRGIAQQQSRLTGDGIKASKLRSGNDACILAVGTMVEAAVGAAELLASEGVSVSVYDVRCAKPLDEAMILDALDHPLVVTVEDGMALGGVGSHIVASMLNLRTESTLPALTVLGTPDAFLPHAARPAQLHSSLGLDAIGLSQHLKNRLFQASNVTELPKRQQI